MNGSPEWEDRQVKKLREALKLQEQSGQIKITWITRDRVEISRPINLRMLVQDMGRASV